ncbi:ArsR/SmtB family transcription factor [Haploplasma axanthum]|uniref:Transcriptional repressor smtB homolog n=1 Tax=Haploplasma axanthum TaxID=29552 RepID=A0A449BCW5_HAPAX|nr:metalloregulator ArsR/SmtB family transcription factor [Haploplasma axanthum]VEU80265.1 Transcriptional repressor smtB homolog [Haploplasma axanthum]
MNEKLSNIKESMINKELKDRVSNLFKVISDPTRISILFALKGEDLTVTELTIILDMTQSAVSHQLRVLRDANLVINKKIGKEVIYRLADEHVHMIFNQAIEHVIE